MSSSSYEPNNMQLVYNTHGSPPPMYTPSAQYDSMAAGVLKRKRGRPRKYAAADAHNNSPAAAVDGGGLSSPSSGRRPRGRPPGSLNKQQQPPATAAAASGSPGVGFMPHILDVKTGEDMLAKLMWFSQNSTRALCVMSANGSVSNVTLRQSSTSGGTVTYKGQFEILSLSGSFMVAEVDGQRSRMGGLSVALSGPDGRVLGGNVAGLLTAASPVQLIVGSFVPASQKQSKTVETVGVNNEAENLNAPQSESSGGGHGYSFAHTTTTNHHHSSNPQGMPWR